MKRSLTFISKGLLAGVLVAGMGIVVAPASAQPSAQPATTGVATSSNVMLSSNVSLKGRPPYKRHAANEQQLEQVRFARFEEKSGVAKDGHKSIYHGVQSKRPPYNRRN